MDMVSSETISILRVLAPGFIAAWILAALTVDRKQSELQKVVQALIFSFIAQALLITIKFLLEFVGRKVALGEWNPSVELVWSLISGCLLGVLLAGIVNSDRLFRVLRFLRLTKQTARPSVWYSAFSDHPAYVVLHVSDGRRIFGWPIEWPSVSGEGYIRLSEASWLTSDDDGSPKTVELESDEFVLVRVSDVVYIEFLKPEISVPPAATSIGDIQCETTCHPGRQVEALATE